MRQHCSCAACRCFRAGLAKRRRSPAGKESAPAKLAGRWSRPEIKHTSVYLPEAAYEALRQVAFDERCKIHDLLIEGVELALKKRGYPALADMKAKWQWNAESLTAVAGFPSCIALSALCHDGTHAPQQKTSIRSPHGWSFEWSCAH